MLTQAQHISPSSCGSGSIPLQVGTCSRSCLLLVLCATVLLAKLGLCHTDFDAACV